MALLDAHELLLFAAAGLVLNLTPGPDLVYIAARSVGQGLRAGVWSALGISAGCLVHTVAAAFGLSLLLRNVPWAYHAVRGIGVVYLCWLGFVTIRGARTALAPSAPPAGTFLQATLTNVLNPKVALFFLAFLPQFAHPERGALELQMLILGALFTFNGTWVCLGVAWLASRFRRTFDPAGPASRRVRQASGGMLIALGLALALDRRT